MITLLHISCWVRTGGRILRSVNLLTDWFFTIPVFRPHINYCRIVNIVNKIRRNWIKWATSSDSGKSTLLISLDLSAAFDTIDHSILLSRLSTSFGFTHTVYSWLQSYIIGRYQSAHIGRHSSTPTLGTSGVPQGSVLGPLLFTAQCTLVQMRGLGIACCLSVCLSVCPWRWWAVIT